MFKKTNLFAIAALSLFSACNNLPPSPGLGTTPASQSQSAMQTFRVQFSPEVNGQPFACGQSYSGLGTTQSTIEPRDFRMYLSNVKLIKANGESVPLQLTQDDTWQKHSTVLLDFEDKAGACETGTPETNFEIQGQAPAGDYQGIRFELGLPFEMNHQDLTTAASPMNVSSMFWSWRGGYKYLRADMSTTGLPQGFYLHLGSSGCTGSATPSLLNTDTPAVAHDHAGFHLKHDGEEHSASAGHEQASTTQVTESQSSVPEQCAHRNVSGIVFNRFDAQQQKIVVDLGHLLSQSDLNQNQAETASGCMSQPEDNDCRPIFANLGLPFADQSVQQQRFFAVQSK